MDVRAELLARVSALPPEVRDRSGAVLYSGWSSLRPGPLYIMGLNPGGDPTAEPHRSKSMLHDLEQLPNLFSSYADVRWDGARTAGSTAHQKRVSSLACAAGLDVRDVVAANAIFTRTSRAGELIDPVRAWATHFWPIHQWMLSIVRPDIIVCLGNGLGLSSWTLLRAQALVSHEHPSPNYRMGRFADVVLPFADGTEHAVLLIGAPHPSRFPVPTAALDCVRAVRRSPPDDPPAFS